MSTNIYDLIHEYRTLKENSFYPYKEEEGDPEFVLVEKRERREMLEDLTRKIAGFEDKNYVNESKENVIHGLDILLKYVKKNKAGFPLDRNQGLVIESYIFGKIAGVIRNSLKNVNRVSYGEFYYTVEET